MKLLTKAIKAKLPPLFSQDGKDPTQVPIVVKFFTPDANCTWYITEGEPTEEDDWVLFGWCSLGFGPGFDELGTVMLSDLESIRGPLGLKVERDIHFKGMLAEVMN